VLVQFEDFRNERAYALLARYRDRYLCFNDDIQGTGAMTVGGLIGALRAKGLGFKDILTQRILIVGAGSAGIGVANSISTFMIKQGAVDIADTASRIWLVDQRGLLTSARDPASILPGQEDYLRPEKDMESLSILEVIHQVQPHILLGLSGFPDLFTDDVCRAMASYQDKPIIFPMSNPSSKAEASAERVFRCTDGRAVFASGSPFEDVTLPSGRVCISNQANNMFIFPGLGQGAILGNCQRVSDGMLMAASEALASHLSEEDLAMGMVYPKIGDIREVGGAIAGGIMILWVVVS